MINIYSYHVIILSYHFILLLFYYVAIININNVNGKCKCRVRIIYYNADLYIANQDVSAQTWAYSLRSDVQYSFKCCILIVATFFVLCNNLLQTTVLLQLQ